MFGEKVLYDIEINDYEFLWVNDVLLINVDELHFTNNFMFMTYEKKIVGKIHRNNIKKLIVENYEEEFETDLIDNLIHLFDVRIIGD